MISKHSAHLTPLPFGFRTWLWRYTYLLLISMLWHRQAIFESKGDKLSSSAECSIRTQRVSETQSPADWMQLCSSGTLWLDRWSMWCLALIMPHLIICKTFVVCTAHDHSALNYGLRLSKIMQFVRCNCSHTGMALPLHLFTNIGLVFPWTLCVKSVFSIRIFDRGRSRLCICKWFPWRWLVPWIISPHPPFLVWLLISFVKKFEMHTSRPCQIDHTHLSFCMWHGNWCAQFVPASNMHPPVGPQPTSYCLTSHTILHCQLMTSPSYRPTVKSLI